MTLIRKFATPLALLAVLLCTAAAPYMIAEDPDSMIFRNGALGLILLLGCAAPVRDALARASRRTLAVSLGFGFLFALALSLGAELLVYDGLLRGMGSLVRRMAVPVLAAPLFGGLCARIALGRLPGRPCKRCLPVWAFALAIFLCWLPLLLAYYPGMLNYDFPGEFGQHVAQSYSNIHPLLHSAVSNGIVAVGEMLGSRTLGVLMMTLAQMAVFALALGYSCAFAQRRGVPAWGVLGMTALYALHPIFSVMALSTTKDTPFAAALLTLCLLTWELLEDADAFFKRPGRAALFVLSVVCTALMRNNGLFALALLMPALLFGAKACRKRAAALCGAGLCATALTMTVLSIALSPETLPSFQLYSLPAQQLVRAYNSDTMSDADKAEIRAWYTDDTGLIVHPHLGDGAKGYLDRPRIQQEGEQFLALWARHAKAHAHEYVEAFLMLNVGSWYPDDLSHSTIYPDASWNDKGYLQTTEYDMTDQEIYSRSYLPKLKHIYERICRRNDYQEYPVIAQLFATATPFWVLMLAFALCIARRERRLTPALLGMLGLWLSYLFGPCTLPRYMLPLFCLAPVALLMAMRKETYA